MRKVFILLAEKVFYSRENLFFFLLLTQFEKRKPCIYHVLTIHSLLRFTQDEILANTMPAKGYDYDSSAPPPTRLERLLREHELRKFNRSNYSTDDPRDAGKEVDSNGARSSPYDLDKWFRDEEFLEGLLAARRVSERPEMPEGRPSKQRLLVVANRLPVAATRKGEDSWTLEISAGGLVSALLGNYAEILH